MTTTTITQFLNASNLFLRNIGNFTTNIMSSPSMISNLEITLPTTAGNANDFLQTNGTGVTTWSPVAVVGNNFYLYAAVIASTGNITAGDAIPLTQYPPTTTGITWSTDTATVTEAGTYNITFRGNASNSTTIGISISGAAVELYHRTGNTNNRNNQTMSIIVQLVANDTIRIINIQNTRSFNTVGSGVAVFLTIFRIST